MKEIMEYTYPPQQVFEFVNRKQDIEPISETLNVPDATAGVISDITTEHFLSSHLGLNIERLKESYGALLTQPIETLQARTAAITAYEGLNMLHLVNKFPNILAFSEEAFASRLEMLDNLGLEAIAIANRKPQILSHAPETIADRFAGLAKRGLDAAKVITRAPGAMDSNDQKLDRLFEFLETLGLDPVRTINSAPTIVPLEVDDGSETSLMSKLANLESLGFDPIAVACKYPKILTSSPETIRNRLDELRPIVEGLNPNISVEEVFEASPIVITRKVETLYPAARFALSQGTQKTDSAIQIANIFSTNADASFLKAATGTFGGQNRIKQHSLALELLGNVDIRRQIGPFAVLAFYETLSEKEQKTVDESFRKHGDIKTLHVDVIECGDN